jgi:mRNA interferase HicA
MKYSELLRILKRDGWYGIRQSGSHLIMKHPTKENQIIVPCHASKEIKKGTLVSILKDAEIKIEKR